jgi:cyanophycin synthetase
MEIVSTAVYVGPNVYSKLPLIRLTLDLHKRAGSAVRDYADVLIDPLVRHLPGLAAARAENGAPLFDRLIEDPDCGLGVLAAHVALALQQRGGADASAAMARPAAHPEEVEVLFGYESEEVGLEAGQVACDIIL